MWQCSEFKRGGDLRRRSRCRTLPALRTRAGTTDWATSSKPTQACTHAARQTCWRPTANPGDSHSSRRATKPATTSSRRIIIGLTLGLGHLDILAWPHDIHVHSKVFFGNVLPQSLPSFMTTAIERTREAHPLRPTSHTQWPPPLVGPPRLGRPPAAEPQTL